ncbi:MAG TPA: hypothetical protein VF101_18825, partial [Gaiellaceae bacterium]
MTAMDPLANGRLSPLDHASLHEFWRMQLLDELHGRLTAVEWNPKLDPDGTRAVALRALIARVEAAEAEALRNGFGDDRT